MSIFETLWKLVKWALEEIDIEDESDDAGLPPVVSPAKQAERHWPTVESRPARADAWPPYTGHRVPLGGER